QAQMLGNNTCWQAPVYLAGFRHELVAIVPELVGGTAMSLHNFGKRSPAVVGSPIVGWVVCGAVILMLLRLVWLSKPRSDRPAVAFGVYLMVVGCCALAAYPFACGQAANEQPTLRYLTLAMLFPAGLFAAFMNLEYSRYMKAAVISTFVLWGAANLVDNVRVLRAALTNPESDPHRELADFLL